MNLTCNTELIFEKQEDSDKVIAVLEAQRAAFNSCSKVKFTMTNGSIVDLHRAFYHKFRKSQDIISTKTGNIKEKDVPSQIIIRALNEIISSYRSIKSNKHKITEPISKKRLSMRLDKRIYVYKNETLSLSTLGGKRVKCSFRKYPRLQRFLDEHRFLDPLLYIRDGKVWIALTFDIPDPVCKTESACGVDLGIRISAATSEGNFYADKKFNKDKRKLRFLKRQLQKSKSGSAKKKLIKLRHKERNKNRNQTHLLANQILSEAKADVIVLENLKGLKKKKNQFQNKNCISQVPFFLLKQILTYKAPKFRKTVVAVSPTDTSKIDHRTNKKDGVRKGRRYYGNDGVVLDADNNAAINIARRSKLPVSYRKVLDGQALVREPNVNLVRS